MALQPRTPRNAPLSSPLNAPIKIRERRVFVTYGPDELHPTQVYHHNMRSVMVRSRSSPALTSDGTMESVTQSQAGVAAMVTSDSAGDDQVSGALSPASTESAPDRFVLHQFSTINTVQQTQQSVQIPAPARAPLPTSASRETFTEEEYRGMLHRAQRLYGPKSCVVVGNLPNKLPNNVLSGIVWDEFEKYGLCAVCVFRGHGPNGVRRPYAIVQYEETQDAAAAYFCGQETKIRGRPVRVEFSLRRRKEGPDDVFV